MVENLEKLETCNSSKRGVVRSNLRNCNKAKGTAKEERKESKGRKKHRASRCSFLTYDRLVMY